jgi:prepilin-type N-terminal cleavage/methylation domain-containing protein
MNVCCKRRGFTLVEMLVVIAIIVVLVGLLFPVFQTARQQASMTQTMGNLSQLSIALKSYRTDHGRYPFAPYYNTDLQKYMGGFSALYPDYVDNKALLVCKGDRSIDGIEKAAMARVYSSYNGKLGSPDKDESAGTSPSSWDFATDDYTNIETADTFTGPTRWYNWGGYTNDGVDPYNGDDSDSGYYPYMTSVPTWLSSEGLRYKHYPRLMNRHAPDTTVVTHVVHYRGNFDKATEELDIILRIDGSTEKVSRTAWQTPGGDGVTLFVKQRQ